MELSFVKVVISDPAENLERERWGLYMENDSGPGTVETLLSEDSLYDRFIVAVEARIFSPEVRLGICTPSERSRFSPRLPFINPSLDCAVNPGLPGNKLLHPD